MWHLQAKSSPKSALHKTNVEVFSLQEIKFILHHFSQKGQNNLSHNKALLNIQPALIMQNPLGNEEELSSGVIASNIFSVFTQPTELYGQTSNNKNMSSPK